MVVFYCFAAFIAVWGTMISLREDDTTGLWFLAVWCVVVVIQARWTLLRMPWRIVTDESELRFLARTRTVNVPWGQLRSVTSPWYDLNNQVMRWRWDGGKLSTMGAWDGQHRLLSTVEALAPHAEVRI